MLFTWCFMVAREGTRAYALRASAALVFGSGSNSPLSCSTFLGFKSLRQPLQCNDPFAGAVDVHGGQGGT